MHLKKKILTIFFVDPKRFIWDPARIRPVKSFWKSSKSKVNVTRQPLKHINRKFIRIIYISFGFERCIYVTFAQISVHRRRMSLLQDGGPPLSS
jgi:hypothetical protein